MTAQAARRLWLAGLALGLLLAPGFSLFETPPLESLEGYARSGRLGLAERPARGALYVLGRDGFYYPTHEVGTLMTGIPFALAARALSAHTRHSFREVIELLLSWFSAGLFATTLVALVAAGRRVGFVGSRREALTLLSLLASSAYLVHAVQPADVSQAAAVFALTFLAWLSAGTGSLAACLWLGMGCGVLLLLKLSHLPILLAACLLTSSERAVPGWRRAARTLMIVAGALPSLALAAWWNLVRLGAPFGVPYPPISTQFRIEALPAHLAGALISPGKGLLVFTPALLLLPAAVVSLHRDPLRRRDVAWVLGSLAPALLFISGTQAWSGRSGWGIRYYVTWLPLLLLLALGEWRHAASGRRALLRRALLAAGLVVNVAGIVTNSHYRQGLCGFQAWTVRGMPVCAVAALPGNLARALGVPLAETVVPGASSANVWVSNRLAVWWYAARTRGVPPAVSWAVGAGLALAALAAWRSGTRAMETAER